MGGILKDKGAPPVVYQTIETVVSAQIRISPGTSCWEKGRAEPARGEVVTVEDFPQF